MHWGYPYHLLPAYVLNLFFFVSRPILYLNICYGKFSLSLNFWPTQHCHQYQKPIGIRSSQSKTFITRIVKFIKFPIDLKSQNLSDLAVSWQVSDLHTVCRLHDVQWDTLQRTHIGYIHNELYKIYLWIV